MNNVLVSSLIFTCLCFTKPLLITIIITIIIKYVHVYIPLTNRVRGLCTVSYGLGGERVFSRSLVAQVRSARAINQWEKMRIRNLQYGLRKRGK